MPVVPLAAAAVAERPAPGSLADLRQRLERLPYGHPSSPYHVDGERKPPPPRLRHLELAPPTPSRYVASVTSAFSSPSLPDLSAGTSDVIVNDTDSASPASYDFAVAGVQDDPVAETDDTAAASAGVIAEPQVTGSAAEEENAADSDLVVAGNGHSDAAPVSFGTYPTSPTLSAGPADEDEDRFADLSAGDSTSQFPAFDDRSYDPEPLPSPASQPSLLSQPGPPGPLAPSQALPLADEPTAGAAPGAEPPADEPLDAEPPAPE